MKKTLLISLFAILLCPAYFVRGAFLADAAGSNSLAIQEGGLMSIDYVHNQIHLGSTFRVCRPFAALANNANAILAIGSTNRFNHFVASISTSGAMWVSLYEVDWTNWHSAFGTNRLPVNMSRSLPTNIFKSYSIVQENPTVTNWGTMLCTSLITGSTGNNSVGSDVRLDTEWNFDTNKFYILAVSNVAGSGKDVSINIQWYEKTFFEH